MPFDDTLNIKNGINFAQFLECILQIAYFKVTDEERTQVKGAYSDMLQQIFQDGTLDINTKAVNDSTIALLYSAESQKTFYDNFALLGGIF